MKQKITDTKRMNWIQRHKVKGNFEESVQLWFVSVPYQIEYIRGNTHRQAIDKAMTLCELRKK